MHETKDSIDDYRCIRIDYGKVILSCERVYKGTILPFSDPIVKYSYVAKGKMVGVKNCSSWQGTVFTAGNLYPVGKVVDLDNARHIAVLEDGELCCFLSLKHDPTLTLHKSESTIELEANTPAIVVDGEFDVEGLVAKRFVMIRERKKNIILTGVGSIIKIKG